MNVVSIAAMIVGLLVAMAFYLRHHSHQVAEEEVTYGQPLKRCEDIKPPVYRPGFEVADEYCRDRAAVRRAEAALLRRRAAAVEVDARLAQRVQRRRA